ncbi:MAG: hypothetical protein IJ228_05225 [Succinivibrio sp.]|nr:hypothetical protein [Succinivibrio sp.]
MLSALVAYALNLVVYLSLTALWDWPYKTLPLCIGIIVGLTVNFLLADRVVFKERND